MLETAAKSSADSARIGTRNVADRPPKAVVRTRLLALRDLDGRTAAAKRARALAAALAEELGGAITASQAAAVERAATLSALAENVRSRRLAGDESVSLEDLVRVDAAADRAMRRLNLVPGTARSDVPSLASYLAGLAAADADPRGKAADASIDDPGAERPAEAKTPSGGPTGGAGDGK